MSQQWFLSKAGQEEGPLTSAALREWAVGGQLGPSDLVRRSDKSDWVEARKIKGLFDPKPASEPPPLPVEAQASTAAAQQPVAATSTVEAAAHNDGVSSAYREPPPLPAEAQPAELNNTYSDAFGMVDGGNLGIESAVKTTVNQFRSLDYGYLVPFRKIVNKSLLRKKAVRWVIGFGLYPLVLMFLKQQCDWSFEGSTWWIGGYFCLFWAAYFHGILHPQGKVWQRGVKWALFTVMVGLPLLLIAQQFPIIRSLYSGTESQTFVFRLVGFVLGVGILEETCKALPLLVFALRKKEVIPLENGIFLGMMSGFGFALAEVVQYSMGYWTKTASISALAIAEAVDNSTNMMGQVNAAAFGSQMKQLMPQLVEVSGGVLLAQIVRFMTLPLLHACWAGVVGWFVATASRRKENPWPVVIIGILFMAALHGLYDVFSDGLLGIVVAAISLLTFMGYLLHGQEEKNVAMTPDVPVS
jgi:RsiW-degrading membrane proteinase PrsW (M82 family)